MEDGYQPSDEDIVSIHWPTVGTLSTAIPQPTGLVEIVDCGGSSACRRKWPIVFGSVSPSDIIVFVVALDSFLSTTNEGGETKNVMKQSLEMFEEICKNEKLKSNPLILVLNKMDLFFPAISRKSELLSNVFPDFSGDDGHSAFDFVCEKFRSVAGSRNIFTLCSSSTDLTVPHPLLPFLEGREESVADQRAVEASQVTVTVENTSNDMVR